MNLRVCIVIGAILCSPLLAFAASLPQEPDPAAYCPYLCQNAKIKFDTLGNVQVSCDPTTLTLDNVEENTSEGAKPSAKAAYQTCQQRQCGIVTYFDPSGKAFQKDRCKASYAEGDTIPTDRAKQLQNLYQQPPFDPGLLAPIQRQIQIPPGTVFDEQGNPLNWKPSLSDIPLTVPTPEESPPFNDFLSSQFDRANKSLNDKNYGGDVSSQYQPAVPYIPFSGGRTSVVVNGDTYSVPDYLTFSKQPSSVNAGAMGNMFYGNGSTFNTVSPLQAPNPNYTFVTPSYMGFVQQTWNYIKSMFGR